MMLQRLQRLQGRSGRRGAFTLVEIMIVVAIIALLATLAVPYFLRAAKRAQAATVLNDARQIGHAIDQWATENNKLGTDSVAADSTVLKAYFKPAIRLYREWPNDIMGNAYVFATVDEGVKINATTQANFSDVIDDEQKFWGDYYAGSGEEPAPEP
jgi:prepilin-type N-terminal cleavage/methylation domain-containing protein